MIGSIEDGRIEEKETGMVRMLRGKGGRKQEERRI